MSEKWNSKIQFPSDSNFQNRILGASFGPSKSNSNPQITINWEVVSPQDVEIGGKQYNIAGVKSTTYHVVTTIEDGIVNATKTEANHERITKLYTDLGLSTEGLDWDNLDVSGFKGKVAYTQMSPDVKAQRKNPTMEQLEQSKKTGKFVEGDPMKHPVTGKELIQYWPKVREIFGVVEA